MRKKWNLQALFILCLCCIWVLSPLGVQATENDAEMIKITEEILRESEPKLMVESYEITDGEVSKGEEFTLQIKVRNTNAYANAFNVVTTFTAKTDNVRLVDTVANQKYDAEIPAGQTVTYEYRCEVMDIYERDTLVIEFNFSYADKYGRTYGNNSMITPRIDKNCILSINSLSVAEGATVGAKALVNVRYSSTGMLDVKNAKMVIDGNIIGGTKEVELTELTSNEQRSMDYYVNFSEAGDQVLAISFVYSDENGNEYELEKQDFTVKVNSFQATVTSDDGTAVSSLLDEENKKYAIIGVASLGVVILLIIVIIVVKCTTSGQKKRRK